MEDSSIFPKAKIIACVMSNFNGRSIDVKFKNRLGFDHGLLMSVCGCDIQTRKLVLLGQKSERDVSGVGSFDR